MWVIRKATSGSILIFFKKKGYKKSKFDLQCPPTKEEHVCQICQSPLYLFCLSFCHCFVSLRLKSFAPCSVVTFYAGATELLRRFLKDLILEILKTIRSTMIFLKKIGGPL